MGSFDLFFMGGEQAGWRSLLADCGVDNLGISYWSWRKRRKRLDDVDIASYGFAGVLLDSGGFSANSKPEQLTVGEWAAYGEEYARFAVKHIDDLALVTEFDALVLGPEWVARQRREVWSQVDPEKFMPIWHPEQGLEALEQLGENYRRIGITEKAVTGQGLNVTPHLNALARAGVQLHGVAMTKPTVLRQVAFATAASTSWLSPSQYGDTIVWVNNQLTRYPVKMRDQARLRHRVLFEDAGFDPDRIQADDKTEVTRLAVWSWLQQEAALQTLRGDLVVDRSSYALAVGESVDEATGEVTADTKPLGVRNAEVVRAPAQERRSDEIRPLPMFGQRMVQAMNADTREVEEIPLLEVRGASARRCDTCVIKDKCGEFKPATTCAYSIPTEIKTPEQRKAFMTGMIELQAQRVQFGLLVEQVNGGYPDPNLSQEYDRMLKAIQVQADLEDNRDFLKISVEGRGKVGALSQLFGFGPKKTVTEQDEAETDRLATRVIEGQRVT